MKRTMHVYLVIDDYTPDAGSSIYGCYTTAEKAQEYIDIGMAEEYGEDYAKDSNAYVKTLNVAE